MLYDRWRQISSARPSQIALDDWAGGRQWTFGELAAAAEEDGPAATGPVVLPVGMSANFIIPVLRAWRRQQVVCPLEPGQAAPHLPGPLPQGIVHLKTTSATSGAPRLVAFTAAQLLADARNIVTTMGLRPEWPNLGVISLAHSYGFSNLALPLLLHGVPLVIVGSALPEPLRRAAATLPAVTLAAVPALWRTWLEAQAIPRNVRLAISAGAPLPVALEQRVFSACGLKIHNFYGSSECGGIAYDASLVPRREDAWAGAPLSQVQVCIGASGCVEVRSQAVGETYWPEPSPTLQPGLFQTNDLGEILDGILYLRGRASDLINIAGRKVAPELIERALATHPQVRECLVFGVPSLDPQRGERIVACVAGNTDAATLKQFLMLKLPAWQVPREWWFVASLTANPRGKLSRPEWRRRYLENTGKAEVAKGS